MRNLLSNDDCVADGVKVSEMADGWEQNLAELSASPGMAEVSLTVVAALHSTAVGAAEQLSFHLSEDEVGRLSLLGSNLNQVPKWDQERVLHKK